MTRIGRFKDFEVCLEPGEFLNDLRTYEDQKSYSKYDELLREKNQLTDAIALYERELEECKTQLLDLRSEYEKWNNIYQLRPPNADISFVKSKRMDLHESIFTVQERQSKFLVKSQNDTSRLQDITSLTLTVFPLAEKSRKFYEIYDTEISYYSRFTLSGPYSDYPFVISPKDYYGILGYSVPDCHVLDEETELAQLVFGGRVGREFSRLLPSGQVEEFRILTTEVMSSSAINEVMNLFQARQETHSRLARSLSKNRHDAGDHDRWKDGARDDASALCNDCKVPVFGPHKPGCKFH
jgi:hypothetical protein